MADKKYNIVIKTTDNTTYKLPFSAPQGATTKGDTGLSAFEVWKHLPENVGKTEEDFFKAIKGDSVPSEDLKLFKTIQITDEFKKDASYVLTYKDLGLPRLRKWRIQIEFSPTTATQWPPVSIVAPGIEGDALAGYFWRTPFDFKSKAYMYGSMIIEGDSDTGESSFTAIADRATAWGDTGEGLAPLYYYYRGNTYATPFGNPCNKDEDSSIMIFPHTDYAVPSVVRIYGREWPSSQSMVSLVTIWPTEHRNAMYYIGDTYTNTIYVPSTYQETDGTDLTISSYIEGERKLLYPKGGTPKGEDGLPIQDESWEYTIDIRDSTKITFSVPIMGDVFISHRYTIPEEPE